MPSLPPRTRQRSTRLGGRRHRERDVDALRARDVGRVDLAVADDERAAPRADPVHGRAGDAHVLEHDVLAVAHLDPDLAAEDGQVAHRHVVGADQDAAADDGTAALQDLRAVEDERACDRAAVQVDDGRLGGPGGAEDGQERDGCGRGERVAAAAELAAVVAVGEVERRQEGVADHLREQPREDEEPERRAERCRHVEPPDERHREPELEQPQRQRRPTGLVGKQAVIERRVERESRRRPWPP